MKNGRTPSPRPICYTKGHPRFTPGIRRVPEFPGPAGGPGLMVTEGIKVPRHMLYRRCWTTLECGHQIWNTINQKKEELETLNCAVGKMLCVEMLREIPVVFFVFFCGDIDCSMRFCRLFLLSYMEQICSVWCVLCAFSYVFFIRKMNVVSLYFGLVILCFLFRDVSFQYLKYIQNILFNINLYIKNQSIWY